MQEWIIGNWRESGMVVVSVFAAYLVVLTCIRFVGLRSLAKMSPTDFVWTVATGSLLASTVASPKPSLVVALVAFVTIFGLRLTTSVVRRRTEWFSRVAENEPILLMEGSEVLEENLRATEVTRQDLFAKLRESNVTRLEQVLAVVMETTGDISVLHSADPDRSLEASLLEDVRRAAR